jgi:hypothetical protein
MEQWSVPVAGIFLYSPDAAARWDIMEMDEGGKTGREWEMQTEKTIYGKGRKS